MTKRKSLTRGKIISVALIGGLLVIVGAEILGFNIVSGLQNIVPEIDDTQLEVPFGDLPPEEIEELPVDGSFDCISFVDNSLVEPCDGEPILVPSEPEPLPPIITSNDTETEQYEEEVNSEPVTIAIKSITKLIDGQGNVTESITNSDIPLLAFFVEDVSNVDFSNGIIETELQIITSRQTEINGIATVTIFISNQTVGDPIRLDVDVMTDENGIASIDFLSPTGFGSKQLTFLFRDHIDEFPVGLSKIKYVLDLELETDQDRFVQEDLVIYSVDIVTDPIKIIILNEEGGLVRVYPTDDKFTVRNSGQYSRFVGCASSTGGRCTSSYIYCNKSSIGTAGTLEIFDLDNNKVFEHLLKTRTGNTNWSSGTICSGSGDSVLLQRNAEYTVQFTSVKSGLPSSTWTLQTPESQKNYSYTCSWSFTLPVSCNFPKTGEIVG